MHKKMEYSFPDEVLEHVFSFIQSDKDRNSVSMVCKSWYEIERWCRRKVLWGTATLETPLRRLQSVPDGWGGYVFPWIVEMAGAFPWLEEIKLKRMVVTDESLELLAKSFKNVKVLILSSCEGFSCK
ncbi:hypothetical protein F3Y22_tig00111848pilonHSYRG00382 [Hibiscus syriacus]|uniref:F-box domain-containing protein n=1 Tax=Hibiscus syriacus TaxID=106335 RepID=A0A6A2XQV4_HIBSY|nr:hypothetical protein F3Y22_tig00111848pilonHSYRG00382 [Hibiscus syriacus]